MSSVSARLPSRRRPLVLTSASLFAVAAVAVLSTLGDYGLSSDVGNYLWGSLRQLEWLRKLGASILGGGGDVLTRDAVLEHWRWWPERIPHPPLSRELSGIGFAVSRSFLDPLAAYRVAVAITFAALVACAGGFVYFGSGSVTSGIAAGAALLTTPALFAYGHLASTDMFLAAFWFGSVCCLEVHLRRDRAGWLWGCGLLAGAALATKFTGLLLGPVLLLWLLLRRRADVRRLGVLLGTALAVFFLVNPVLWVAPLEGLSGYLGAGFARSQAEMGQIRTYYLGEVHAYRPPWHYPFVWTAVVVPIPISVAAAYGLLGRPRGRLVALCVVNLGVVYAAAMLPATPLHDGIRLLLPAFPFIAVLAGVGAGRLGERAASLAGRAAPVSRDFIQAAVLIAVFAIPAWRTAEYHPYQLSYFNGLIGGVRGAHEKGLEISYLKEALTPATLAELAPRMPADAVVNPGFFLEEMCFYQTFGYLPRTWILEARHGGPDAGGPRTLTCSGPDRPLPVILPRAPRRPDFVFLLDRRGERTLLEHALARYGGDPFFQVALQGVPLLRVYRNDG